MHQGNLPGNFVPPKTGIMGMGSVGVEVIGEFTMVECLWKPVGFVFCPIKYGPLMPRIAACACLCLPVSACACVE